MLFWSDFTCLSCFSKTQSRTNIEKRNPQLRTNKKRKLKDYFTDLTEFCSSSHYLRVLVYQYAVEPKKYLHDIFILFPAHIFYFPFLSFQQELVLRDNKLTNILDMCISMVTFILVKMV